MVKSVDKSVLQQLVSTSTFSAVLPEKYIKPEDILNKLSEEDRSRFNRCVFTDVEKWVDGSIEISCLLFNDDKSEKAEGRWYHKSTKAFDHMDDF
jgi:hypothetical protein